MIADLHMHSNASDGVLSPGELVTFAASRGVEIMALTDHDTFDGVDSLQGRALPIPVLTGVELSLREMHGLHLLAYGSTDAISLRATVRDLAQKRLSRARRMVEKLAALGIVLDYDALCASAQGTVGRMHIARAMQAGGYVRTTEEAFDRYIGEGREGYVQNESLTMAQALPLLRANGFVPVLAHPAELKRDDMTLRMLIESWQQQGLMGVEVYHPSQEKHGFAPLERMVRRMGLLVTGGSDHHCNDNRHGQPGYPAAHWHSADQDVSALLTAVARAASETR